jgi:hypothetical protein
VLRSLTSAFGECCIGLLPFFFAEGRVDNERHPQHAMDITFHNLIAASGLTIGEWAEYYIIVTAMVLFFGWITRLVWRIPSDVWVFKVLAIFIALIGCLCLLVAVAVGVLFGFGCGPITVP